MNKNKFEAVFVKFKGRNVALWELHFRIFVDGKGFSRILDGSKKIEDDEKKKFSWKKKNAHIISWILNSVEHDISLSLRCNTPKYTLIIFDMFRVFCRHNLNVS